MVGVLYLCITGTLEFLAHFRKLLFYGCMLCLFVWVPNFVGRSRKGRCNPFCHFRSHNYIYCVHRLEYLVYNLLMLSPHCLNVPGPSCCIAFHSAKGISRLASLAVEDITCNAANIGLYDTEVGSIHLIR